MHCRRKRAHSVAGACQDLWAIVGCKGCSQQLSITSGPNRYIPASRLQVADTKLPIRPRIQTRNKWHMHGHTWWLRLIILVWFRTERE
jgi:hypothetical protein